PLRSVLIWGPMAERYGGYTLLEQIGVGGMAEVFLARRSGVEGFEKEIVIKRIRPHLSAIPSFVNMFLGEAKLAAQPYPEHIWIRCVEEGSGRELIPHTLTGRMVGPGADPRPFFPKLDPQPVRLADGASLWRVRRRFGLRSSARMGRG
ncbi:MAG: hypothetical protein ABFS02_07820, partial [Pseudomonadota bacterium]